MGNRVGEGGVVEQRVFEESVDLDLNVGEGFACSFWNVRSE